MLFPCVFLIFQSILLLHPCHADSTFPLQCAAAFGKLNFSIADFERYPVFFAPDSFVVLAEAGTYTGPDAIAEYVGFAQDSSPFHATVRRVSTSTSPVGFDPVTGSCTFLTSTINHFVFEPKFGLGTEIDIAVGLKITFSVPRNVILRINVYYARPFLSHYFGTLQNDGAKRYICLTLARKCRQMHKRNGSPSMRQCMNRLDALPKFSAGRYLDGLDYSCRVLHSTFAAKNPVHCAHISFFPVKDPNGSIKCQMSERVAVSDLFTPEELAVHNKAISTAGIDPKLGFGVPCIDSSSWKSVLGDGSGGCNYVRKYPDARCHVEEAMFACQKTCLAMCQK